MKKFGVKNLLIAGTCYEYGLKNGALNEAISTEPQNSYAIAKDSLRRYLDTQEDQSDMMVLTESLSDWKWSERELISPITCSCYQSRRCYFPNKFWLPVA